MLEGGEFAWMQHGFGDAQNAEATVGHGRDAGHEGGGCGVVEVAQVGDGFWGAFRGDPVGFASVGCAPDVGDGQHLAG